MANQLIDYYRLLSVDQNADLRTIRSAYRRLARRYHPDVAKGEPAGRRFLLVREAYDVLSDPEKRRTYDDLLVQRRAAAIRARASEGTGAVSTRAAPGSRDSARSCFMARASSSLTMAQWTLKSRQS